MIIFNCLHDPVNGHTHRHQSTYNIVGVHGNDKAGRAKLERPRGVKFLGRDVLGRNIPSPLARGHGECCKLPQWDPGGSLATWRFRTFYRLTKPLLVSILMILNLFQ